MRRWTKLYAIREILLDKQPLMELKRKANKAIRLKQKMWTQEEIDLAKRKASILSQKFSRMAS